MPYRYLEDITTADVAFEAWGRTVEEMLVAASDATINVMVDDLGTIADRQRRAIHVEAGTIDALLLDLLQELIYYKDAESLVLRVPQIRVQHQEEGFSLDAEAYGEELDPNKHELLVDVKAVTLHHFQVERTESGWRSVVILDI